MHAHALAALLRNASWQTAKFFAKKNGDAFRRGFLFISENADGKRQSWIAENRAREGAANNDELIEGLVADLKIDLQDLGAVRFAVAFMVRVRATKDFDFTGTARPGDEWMAVEAHDGHGGHIRAKHEILMVGGKKMLSAMSAPQPTKRALAIKTEAANKELL